VIPTLKSGLGTPLGLSTVRGRAQALAWGFAAATSLLSVAACGPSDPCRAPAMRLVSRYSQRYVGHWAVARGDTLTLIQTGDRFKLREVVLDTDRVAMGQACRLRGALVFQAPRAETLAVTWVGSPEQALIYGWPTDLGPFGGIGAAVSGDSLRGAILFEQRVGIRVTPGTTARFVAGRLR